MKIFFAGSNFHGVGEDGRIVKKTGEEKELECLSLIEEGDFGDYHRLVSLYYKDDVMCILNVKEERIEKNKVSRRRR